MSFREKTAWISTLSIAAIYALYFWSAFKGDRPGQVHFFGLLATVIALVVLQTVSTIVVAIVAPKEAQTPRDEREKLIDLRATRVAYTVLVGSIACACFFGAFTPPIVFSANGLLFILVVAEILRSAGQIVQYRRGA